MAIPVRNEEDRIVACLAALARQVGLAASDLGIVLFLNNCTDGTAAVVDAINMSWPMRVFTQDNAAASAGWARRNAMEAASAWLSEASTDDGVLLTSDADRCVGADWVARNLAAIAAGADLVAGRITLDPTEAAALPKHLHARGQLEARYEALLIEIEARLDPEPGNPWPCHWSKSGATLAVRHAVHLAVGGMPEQATGEDRAFVDAVRGRGFVVRHACDIEVVTSGRLDGRATGGVADTIKLRCDEPESLCDDRLERLHRLVWRVLWRRRLRRLHREGRLGATRLWAPALSIPAAAARAIAQMPGFGQAHAAIEAASTRLAYHPVRPRQLPRQMANATRLLWVLRSIDRWKTAPRSVARPTITLHVSEQGPTQHDIKSIGMTALPPLIRQ